MRSGVEVVIMTVRKVLEPVNTLGFFTSLESEYFKLVIRGNVYV